MSETLHKLARCQRITEWLTPHDPRLVAATGQPAPNPGGNVRMGWDMAASDWPRLETEVRRLVVPRALGTRVLSHIEADEYTDRLVLDFTSKADLERCVPLTDKNAIFKRSGRQAWAAIALCGNVLGLAVFAQELEGGAAQARIQPVPSRVLAKIGAA